VRNEAQKKANRGRDSVQEKMIREINSWTQPMKHWEKMKLERTADLWMGWLIGQGPSRRQATKAELCAWLGSRLIAQDENGQENSTWYSAGDCSARELKKR
jgi:hypothetical protein